MDDWDVHKPFCREGGPCSITKPDEFKELVSQAPAREPGGGLLFIPIYDADNTVSLLCSATMDGSELLEARDAYEQEDHDTNMGPYFLIDLVPNSEHPRNIHDK